MKDELRPPWGHHRGDHTRKLTWTQWQELIRQIKTRELTQRQAARVWGVSVMTIYRKIRRLERYTGARRRKDPLAKWTLPHGENKK